MKRVSISFLFLCEGYSYERVDGSVRGEERHLAIKNFGQQPVFIFLLSTRAGRPRRHWQKQTNQGEVQYFYIPTISMFSPNSLKGEVINKEHKKGKLRELP